MKKSLFLTALLIGTVGLSACNLKENYAVQYSFINELATQTKLTATNNGVNLELPFADFTCDVKSVKAELGRTGSTFILTLAGTETEQRCSQKFSAEITGIDPGDYWLQVVYSKAGEQQQVLFRQFTVEK